VGTGGSSSGNGGEGAGGGSGGGGSGISINLDGSITSSSGGSMAADGPVVACTTGDACICPTLSIAVIGNPGQYGSGNNSDTAFQDWLNSSSAGTAKVDNYKTQPTLTADFLKGYNVIIFTGLADDSKNGPWWTFTAAELAAFQDWVNNGGGVITLNGMSGSNDEVNPDNVLLAFTGIQYIANSVTPACILTSAAIADVCVTCTGGSQPITLWDTADPVVSQLSSGITMVGMNWGPPISAPSDAYVAAKIPATWGNDPYFNVLVAKVVGKGRVLVYSDEWITYTSQWDGSGLSSTSDPKCANFLPQKIYQTAQFWYNMIRWTQPSATCFKIVDTQQPVTIW